MYNVYIWKYQPYLLGTFTTEALADIVISKIKDINPQQKVWKEQLKVHYDFPSSIIKYIELTKRYSNA